MKLGIKRKVLAVLVGLLALTTILDALLASYYTNRQNQESAFTALDRSLRAWHDDLQALTQRLEGAALSTVGDTVVLDQLTDLVLYEAPVGEGSTRPQQDAVTMARGLSYAKAVSLNRLHLALRTGGFSRIAVYTGGKLSHAVSALDAGMMIRRGDGAPVWVATAAGAGGKLNMQSWPSWQERALPPGFDLAPADAGRPTVSVSFPAPALATIDIVVPVQGVYEEYLTDILPRKYRVVSEMTIGEPADAPPGPTGKGRRQTAAVLVFSRVIDQPMLDAVAQKTGMSPALFSPDGRHRLAQAGAAALPEALLRRAQTGTPAIVQQTVQGEQGSFYAALTQWRYANQPRMILGLSASRESTLANIRQTVGAILGASLLILALGIAVGFYWVGHFIDPIVALTRAVKQIGYGRSAPRQLPPVATGAPDEIGELGAAFNVMRVELQHAFDTLEQRVQSRTAELRQQTRYLRTLIDTLPLWVWLKDTERRYLAANQASADACGRSVDDMVGKSDHDLWPPELAATYLAGDAEVMATRLRTTVEQAVDGPEGPMWMETYRAPVLDEDGTLLGMVGAARNISERRAAEAARETALAEAVRLARQRSEFLAQMSHELRTPLNAIMGYAQLLRRDAHLLSERQLAGLATIHESGQHLLTLINDILDLARVEAGKMILYPSPTHLGKFLRVVDDIVRVKAEEKSLLFRYEAAADLPAAVTVDDKRLRQVLLNLLGNAVKFTDSGVVTLRVLPAPGQDSESSARLRFEVADTGIGMSADQLDRIFQPFEQVADLQRREGGTGLGLAISQQLIYLMGGTIEVDSEPGKGSLFWFDLVLPVASGALAATPETRTITGYEGPRKRLLIVDDVPHNRAMLLDILQALGFGVADARHGQECLEMLDSFRPDLILMDVMMPVMDGHEATRRIRQMPEWHALPIIAVTASASHEDEVNCLAAGANTFLAKPVDLDLLLNAIGAQLSLAWTTDQATPARSERNEQADLVIPPAQELDVLYQLARIGNMQMVRERSEYLRMLDPAYAPFAKHLHALAQGYQSKALLAFVARYQGEREGPPAA